MQTENANGSRKGIELEKFKRRMIRFVARKLKENKPDAEMWQEMKKEIGTNCKKLWERMRMLTLKKLKRLLEADDRVEFVGPVARMTLTDWLLFDLVIVHQKIDVIDREKLNGSYESKVLSNLFSLVQRFEIEGRSGGNLAEAWTAATVYYNSKGHQCSPMMLQRRWYQIKELTRHKFYKFWFNYRGNQRQLVTAKQDSPDTLQKAIALRYPHVITENFMTWEERIEKRLVILPDELGVKMRQRHLMKASDTTAPDVVLVEPHIETIDLGADSDSNDEPLVNPPITDAQPTVRVKSEPVEDIDIDDNMEQYQDPSKQKSVFDEEIERLQMVEENFDDNPIPNTGNGDSIVIEPLPVAELECDYDYADDDDEDRTETTQKDNDDGGDDEIIITPKILASTRSIVPIVINPPEPSTKAPEAATIVIDDDDYNGDEDILQIEAPKEQVEVQKGERVEVQEEEQFEVQEEQVEIQITNVTDKVGETNDVGMIEASDEPNVAIAEISAVSSVGIKIENVEDFLKKQVNLNEQMEQPHDANYADLLPVIATISSEGVKVEKHLAISEDNFENDDSVFNEAAENCESVDNNKITEVLPVISVISSNGVKVERKTDEYDYKQAGESSTKGFPDGGISKEDSKSLEESSRADMDDLDALMDVPEDLNFADEGIDFADDGIAYIEEDEDDIIQVTDPVPKSMKKETEDESQEKESSDAEANEKAQKFDLKLLMCPVVYTTKLDVMPIFDDSSQYEHIDGLENIDKINTLSKPVSTKSITGCESVNELAVDTSLETEENEEDINTACNVSDDDLFKDDNRESMDSENESDVLDSQRVKLSSYMFRKPKHRSYNPVILCKNPDFNTRLKKLSVGFFMSTRNRMQLQSCIPMTVDLTKAFENKLINGTLYLKDIPQTPVVKTEAIIEINDYVQMTSADLIQPTAVQQSMMNIDETLENELRKRMAERVRAINLPDISQVRRLNQHLLTAEVTPLRLESQTAQSTKIDQTNYVQNIKDDIDNLLNQQNKKEASNSLCVDIPVGAATPPPLLINNPQLWIQHNSSTSLSPTLEPLINKNPAIEEQSTAQPSPPMVSIPIPILDIDSDPAKDPVTPPMSNINGGDTLLQNKDKINANIATGSGTAKPKKIPRKTYYPPLTWYKPKVKPNQALQEQYHTDALLTIDTLYKMLSALDPCKIYGNKNQKKQSKKKIAKDMNSKKKQEEENVNKDSVIDITEDEIIVPAKKPKLKPKQIRKCNIKVKGKVFCCYFGYKSAIEESGDSLDFRRRHRCAYNQCFCCCKSLYPEDTAANVMRAVQSIEPETKSEQNVSYTTEEVSNQVNQTPDDTSLVCSDEEDYSQDEPVMQDLSNNAVVTQTLREQETISLNSSVIIENKSTPVPKVRIYAGASASKHKSANSPTTSQSIPQRTEGTTTITKIIDAQTDPLPTEKIHWSVKPMHVEESPKMKLESRNVKKDLLCSCLPTINKVKQGRIEINGINECRIHRKDVMGNVSRLKNSKSKEGKVILNKKLITSENQPFYVGKGKILLTNIKMPSKETPPSVEPQYQNVRVPDGVKIVLLPDQTLTYVVEAGVNLTPEEYALLPQFLVAIQQQINAVGITMPPSEVNANEIIDLDKDDEPPITSEVYNATTATESVDSTLTPTSDTRNVPDSPQPIIPVSSTNIDDNSKKPTVATVEDFEKEIDTIAKEKRDKNSEDFEMRIDNLEVEKKIKQNMDSTSIENGDTTPVSAVGNPGNNNICEKVADTNIINESLTGDNKCDAPADTESQDLKSTDESINKKSLLSDLMEMSGIMEEDLTPAPVQDVTSEVPIILDTSNLMLQQPVPVTKVPDSPPKEYFKAKSKHGDIELMAVTSFAQLKYASDNQGLFFKLDLDNGQLTSINVCIQKFSQPESDLKPKSVIDLTDDPDVSISGATGSNATPTYLLDQQTRKPTRPAILTYIQPRKRNPQLISTILDKKERLINRLSNNLKPANIQESKKHVSRILKRNTSLLRKPDSCYESILKNMRKIQSGIDLLDSDSPMEEEYLSGDSSDDEPLINKAKRMRLDETQNTPDQVLEAAETLNEQEPQVDSSGLPDKTTAKTNQPQSDNSQEYLGEKDQDLNNEQAQKALNDDVDNEEQTVNDDQCIEEHLEDFTEDDTSQCSEAEAMPVPTNLLLSGGAFNTHNIPLTYHNVPVFRSSNGSDEEDDDCILGV